MAKAGKAGIPRVYALQFQWFISVLRGVVQESLSPFPCHTQIAHTNSKTHEHTRTHRHTLCDWRITYTRKSKKQVDKCDKNYLSLFALSIASK